MESLPESVGTASQVEPADGLVYDSGQSNSNAARQSEVLFGQQTRSGVAFKHLRKRAPQMSNKAYSSK